MGAEFKPITPLDVDCEVRQLLERYETSVQLWGTMRKIVKNTNFFASLATQNAKDALKGATVAVMDATVNAAAVTLAAVKTTISQICGSPITWTKQFNAIAENEAKRMHASRGQAMDCLTLTVATAGRWLGVCITALWR